MCANKNSTHKNSPNVIFSLKSILKCQDVRLSVCLSVSFFYSHGEIELPVQTPRIKDIGWWSGDERRGGGGKTHNMGPSGVRR